jgi:hypothetical protein
MFNILPEKERWRETRQKRYKGKKAKLSRCLNKHYSMKTYVGVDV